MYMKIDMLIQCMFSVSMISDMLEEIIQHQYNVLFQSVFFDVLVGNNFVNAFVKFIGKCWNSLF
jgi:hypothetical protein